ncbi:MAG: hydroxyacid dehydrogenase [Acetobacteraceae bacterium]
MTRPVVLLTDPSIHQDAVARLRGTCDVRIGPAYADEATLIGAARNADAILVRLGMITAAVIDAAPRLRIIACHGSGVDCVDLPAAAARGIVVTNAGPTNAGAVAEYTFALLLALLRKVPQADRVMREGAWARGPQIGYGLEGRTLGIVGLGQIGARVARIALGFGMRVVATDPKPGVPGGLDLRLLPLPQLLQEADIVSVHARSTPATHRFIDGRAMALMRPGAWLINTARGDIVDQPALIAALQSGRLAGAALDAHDPEPLPSDSPLRRMENVVLSPHVAAQTHDSMRAMGLVAAEAILDVLAGRRPRHVYNPAVYRDVAEPQGLS